MDSQTITMTTTYFGQIVDHHIWIIPSKNLKKFIENIQTVDISDEMPLGIQKMIFSTLIKSEYPNYSTPEYLITANDKNFIKSLKSQCIGKTTERTIIKPTYSSILNDTIKSDYLNIQDLHWIYKHIQKQNTNGNTRIYLHELLEESKIVLPKNQVILRNEDLAKRCKMLEDAQRNKEYQIMTKNVNNIQKRIKDDTICSQLRMMNRHLIAVIQYIMSIITGFVFGFYGIEMMTTPLELGFRLLLGIICSLAVGLAELYFLAKALNTDLNDDPKITKQTNVKIRIS